MARSNVDLIIRARDEASTALDKIKSAIEELSGAQRGATTSAAPFDRAMRQVKGSAADAAAAMEKATATVSGKTGAAYQKVATAVDTARAAFSRQRAELEESEASYSALKAQADAARAAVERMSKVNGPFNNTDFADRLKAASKQAATLAREVEKLGPALAKQRAAIGTSEQDLARIEASAVAAQIAVRNLGIEDRKAAIERARLNAEVNKSAAKGIGALSSYENNFDTIKRRDTIAQARQRRLELAAEERGIAGLTAAEKKLEDAAKARLAAQKAAAAETARANAAAAKGLAFLAEAEKRAAENARQSAIGERLLNVVVSRAVRETQGPNAGMGRLAQAEREIAEAIAARARAAVEAAEVTARANANAARGLAALRAAEAGITARIEQEAAARKQAAAENVAAQQRIAEAFRKAQAAYEASKPSLQRVWREIVRLGPASDGAAKGMLSATRAAFSFRTALSAVYGDSRKALSLMQRLRGEVLSLAASMVGFYGVFQQGRGILDAFNTVQAAETRVSAAFGQNANKTAAEMAFLREEADRLGISFETLSATYSKYLISAQQAGLSTEATRKSFRQVAEAARVLKLSQEDIDGVFTALSQIAGKGTLQMEELRQQLGDRLPGAVGIVAKALGYSTDRMDEFYAAVQNGSVSARDAIAALGDGLEQTFGGQLASALDNVTTKIGTLQNLFFERQLTAANSGFIAGLETAIDALNKFLASDEGIKTAQAIGSAFGQLFEAIPVLVENFGLLVQVLRGFAALKLGQIAGGFVAGLTRIGQVSGATRIGLLRLTVEMNRLALSALPAAVRSSRLFSGALGLLPGAIFRVTTAARAMWIALGGPVGIAVTVLSFLAAGWFTAVDEGVAAADAALESHESHLQDIQAAYLRTRDTAKQWRQELQNITAMDLQLDISGLRKARDELAGSFSQVLTGDRTAGLGQLRALDKLEAAGSLPAGTVAQFEQVSDLFQKGGLDAKAYKRYLDGLYTSFSKVIPESFFNAQRELLDKFIQNEEATAKAEAALRFFNGTATDADKVLLGLESTVQSLSYNTSAQAEATEKLADKMRELAKMVPDLADDMQRLDKQEAIRELVKEIGQLALVSNNVNTAWQNIVQAIKTGNTSAAQGAFQKLVSGLQTATQQILQALGMAGKAMEGVYAAEVSGYSGSDGIALGRQFIRDRESFRDNAYWDVNHYRVGYGSDTITDASGNVRSTQQGDTVSVADAERDLVRRVDLLVNALMATVGADKFNSLTSTQQAALLSLAYNYGTLPQDIATAVKSGTQEQVVAAIQARASDNGGVNRDRRFQEAALYGSPQGIAAAQQDTERQIEEEARAREKRAEAEAEFHTQQQQTIANQDFENGLVDQNLLDREVAKALREAELKAQEAGTQLTAEERAEIERVTRAKFQQQALDEARNANLDTARAKEEEIARLQDRKRFLEEQRTYLLSRGDTEGAAQVSDELKGVNAALDEAIQKAVAFWEAIGGPESIPALQALRQTQVELSRVKTEAITTGEELNNSLADKGAAAADAFAQKVAEGMPPLQALGEAFRQMAGEILLELARMIARQALFNALTGGANPGGGAGGLLSGLVNGLFFHTGGVVGATGARSRGLPPALFANALRYHGGGIAGLAPDEVPAVLKKGEEVLTEGDPRHRANGGAAPAAPAERPVSIANFFDAESFLDAALGGKAGSDTIINHVRAKRTAFRAALGIS